jgi:hypothetical protein
MDQLRDYVNIAVDISGLNKTGELQAIVKKINSAPCCQRQDPDTVLN